MICRLVHLQHHHHREAIEKVMIEIVVIIVHHIEVVVEVHRKKCRVEIVIEIETEDDHPIVDHQNIHVVIDHDHVQMVDDIVNVHVHVHGEFYLIKYS